ncbi:hypothetical protein Tco_0746015 [Tanacetum coccineum]
MTRGTTRWDYGRDQFTECELTGASGESTYRSGSSEVSGDSYWWVSDGVSRAVWMVWNRVSGETLLRWGVGGGTGARG